MKAESLLLVLALLVLSPFTLKSQLVCVTGKVTDHLTGSVIRDLSVVEKNSGIGTISSFDGSFSLLLKPGDVSLQFSSDRYAMTTVSFTLKQDTTFQMPMSLLHADRLKKGKKEGSHEGAASVIAQYQGKDSKQP